MRHFYSKKQLQHVFRRFMCLTVDRNQIIIIYTILIRTCAMCLPSLMFIVQCSEKMSDYERPRLFRKQTPKWRGGLPKSLNSEEPDEVILK